MISVAVCAAVVAGTTWANPVDIDYPYTYDRMNDGIAYRTGADPAVVRYGDAYFLFTTLADGYWMSKNLVDWTFIKADLWSIKDPTAPAVLVADGKLFLAQSAMEPFPLLYSTDPEHGHWQFWTRLLPPIPNAATFGFTKPGDLPPGPNDPALFRDADGKTYLYWGSSNTFPIYGAQIDLRLDATAEGEEKRLSFVTQPAALLQLDREAHGWERFGRDHSDEVIKPFVEGSWMNRHGDRYYLQYAAPGTEYNVYATGVYTSESPLGPFTYAPYNPIGYKPGGFVAGSGHGSTFEDAHGNVWNTATMWVGLNWPFERRTELFPAGFHDDGQMWIDTRFGDFPQRMPDHALKDGESTFTGWMLLSYRKKASASSEQTGHAASAITDEDPRTFWAARSTDAGQTLTVDLGGLRTVRAVQVNFADYASGRYSRADDIYARFTLLGSVDGHAWSVIADLSHETRDRPNAYIELTTAAQVRFVRYVHGHVGSRTLAISDLRVFGTAEGKLPAAPSMISARRESDSRNAQIVWKPVKGAVGYNVRWGIAPDRLHSTYQRFAENESSLLLRALTKGVTYYVAVEAFDEHGVSALSRTMTIAP